MRKIDYNLLAAIISDNLTLSKMNKSGSVDFILGKNQAAKEIAECFANEASLNKDKFLKACGIE